MSDTGGESGSEPSPESTMPEPVPDLLVATPETAYFWGRVAGDGELTRKTITVRAGDERTAEALAVIAGADRADHRVAARESAHDASMVRYEDEYELRVFGPAAERAGAALGFPMDGQPGGYRFGAFDEHRAQLVRGLLEACGTVCFRESAGAVGVSFVHDEKRLLETMRSLLADADPQVPTDELAETSSGGYWFGLADGADTTGFAEWVYAGSEQSGLYSERRRTKLRRSVERATGGEVGALSEER
jgi:hypothetical protein